MRSSKALRIFIYRDPDPNILKWTELREYLKKRVGCTVEIREPLFKQNESLARAFAAARVHDPLKPLANREPLPSEIQIEEKFLGAQKQIPGVLYDGLEIQRLCLGLLPVGERTRDHLHLVFVNRLIGTYEQDGRYHIHAAVFGFPTLLSVQGVVFGPARPKEYYTLRGQLSEEELYERLERRFLVLDDPRLTEVVKGYAIQAVFYHVFGNPFCENSQCRLYNARWQEELLKAQLSSPEFCERHEQMLQEFKSEITGTPC